VGAAHAFEAPETGAAAPSRYRARVASRFDASVWIVAVLLLLAVAL